MRFPRSKTQPKRKASIGQAVLPPTDWAGAGNPMMRASWSRKKGSSSGELDLRSLLELTPDGVVGVNESVYANLWGSYPRLLRVRKD